MCKLGDGGDRVGVLLLDLVHEVEEVVQDVDLAVEIYRQVMEELLVFVAIIVVVIVFLFLGVVISLVALDHKLVAMLLAFDLLDPLLDLFDRLSTGLFFLDAELADQLDVSQELEHDQVQ